MRIRSIIFFTLFFSACSSISGLRPQAVRGEEPLLYRGWTFAENAQEQWRLETGVSPLSFSQPIVFEDLVYAPSSRFGLLALHKVTGKVIWHKHIPDGVSAQPIVQDGRLFLPADDAQLYALDAKSGRLLWTAALSAPGIGQPIFVEGRVVVSSSDDAVAAFDPATGKNLWTYKRPLLNSMSIKGGGNLSYAYGKIWVGMSDGSLLAIHPQDGAVTFEKQLRDNLKFADIDAKPLAWKEGFLLVTYDGKLRHIKKDGSVQWEFNAGGVHAPVLSGFDADLMFLASSDGAVYGVNSNGKEVWQFVLPRGVPTSLAIIANSKQPLIAVAASEHKVYVLDALSGALKAQSSLGTASGSYAGLVADGQNFYLVSNYSRVYQFTVRRE